MSTHPLNDATVTETLRRLKDKVTNKTIIDLGMLQSITITSNSVRVILELSGDQAREGAQLKAKAEELLKSVSSNRSVDVVLTLHQTQSKGPQGPHKIKTEKLSLPNIKKIVAVASGKGGVGKSLVAVNLACALEKKGHKVGLLDLDIYGPSIPTMLGIHTEPKKESGKIIPNTYKTMPVMSMGFLIAPEKAVIWRGPMVQLAVQQFLEDVVWGDLDYLIIDMPPGTGDTHLSLTQIVPVDGVVIVTTPQDLACIDAQKSIDMYTTVSIPIIGLVENMSAFTCPHCQQISHPFSQDSTNSLIDTNKAPLLSRIPLASDIRQSADEGKPILETKAYEPIFMELAAKIEGATKNQNLASLKVS